VTIYAIAVTLALIVAVSRWQNAATRLKRVLLMPANALSVVEENDWDIDRQWGFGWEVGSYRSDDVRARGKTLGEAITRAVRLKALITEIEKERGT
jgi:hypothetical protein